MSSFGDGYICWRVNLVFIRPMVYDMLASIVIKGHESYRIYTGKGESSIVLKSAKPRNKRATSTQCLEEVQAASLPNFL